MIQNSVNQMLGTVAIGAKLAGYNKLGEQTELKNLGNKSLAIDEIVRRRAEDPTAEDYAEKVKQLESQQENIELREAELGGNSKEILEGRDGIEYAKTLIPTATAPAASTQASTQAMNNVASQATAIQSQANNYDNLIKQLKGLTEGSDRVANNSTKKALTKILEEHGGNE